ncbi:GGDEF domain-containing protein [Arenimonas sp.]|uniref:GGDEF domain-containing protein n=1 Tax=Arenimonas sp. TaxID=1872635 RepID=UPI002E2F0C1A|nr:GGDEF domain-containing protein [Arenimonas sp.]HEX4854310.1 GGDEF domain-containing protein [Arenimonas sp.]
MGTTWIFDIRSALLVGALLTLLIGVVLLVVGRSLAAEYRPSLFHWVAATLLQPAGFVMLSLRDQLDPWVSTVLANTCIALAFGAYARSLRLFYRAPPAGWLLSGLVLLSVLISIYWGVLSADLTRRLIAISLTLGGLLGYSAWTVFRHAERRGPIRLVTGGVFALAAAIMVYRAAALVVDPGLVTGVFQITHVQLLTYAVGSVLPVIATVGFLLMCTERSQRELERAARVDYLTDCYNRRAIEEQGARAMAAARRHGMPLAVLVIDIDHFKLINDELGHAAGDQALVQSVARIRAEMRAEDVLGRLGGEEFIVLMPNTDSASAASAGERIRLGFAARPLVLEEGRRAATLSIGVATLAPMDRLFSQLLQRADRAMYAAKNAGRNLVMADAMSGWEPGPPG